MFRRKIINKHGGIILNKGVTKLVAGGLVLVTIGGSCYYLGNSAQPPTYIKTEIVQTHDNEIKMDYQEMVISELQQEEQIIIASNKIELPVKQTEKHWYGSKSQEITFSAIGRYVIDLKTINEDNVVVNENNKSITIYIGKPIKMVELLENETKLGEVDNGLFTFGDIEYTLEDVENMKHQVKCDMLVEMDSLMEQAEKAASNSIKRIITTVTKNNYDIKIVFIK